MRHYRTAGVLAGAALFAGFPVQACMTSAPLDLKEVRFADVVVVGRVENYRMVLDPDIRRKHRETMEQISSAMPEVQPPPDEPDGFMSDYAGFDILVDEVLLGQAGSRIAATWDNSTFAEPESMPPGPFLIALRRARSRIPPLRGASATILPHPEPNILAVLQAPCADSFIFESSSKQAAAVRRILAKKPKRSKGGR